MYSDTVSSDGQLASLDPVLAFDVDNDEVCQGDTVHFYNNTLYASSYTWLFPGGTPNSSNDENPAVVYNQPGDYDVTLIAYNSAGVNFALTHNSYIHVHAAPVADFSAVPQNLTLPDTLVVFTNNSQNATSYLWNFGDGTTSTDENPYHAFSAAGDYNVVLYAMNDYCPADTASAVISVVSNVAEVSALAGVKVSPNPAVNFINISANSDLWNKVQKVELLSSSGKVISEVNIKTRKNVNVSKLPSGTYFIKIYTDNASAVYKFIKK